VDDSGKTKVYKHITNLGDGNIIPPAYLTLFGVEFLDKDVALRVCKFSDCRIEVLTAGFEDSDIISLTDEQKNSVKHLRIRTILERVVWGPLKAILDFTKITSEKKLGKIKIDYLIAVLTTYYPDVINAIYATGDGNESKSGYDIIGNTVKKMLGDEIKNLYKGEFGPLTSVLLASALDASLMDMSLLDVNVYKAAVEAVIVNNLQVAIVTAAAIQVAKNLFLF